ncbi:MAG: tRNA (adenosine(37)-N6)-threonylcarbamoyltransferase complex dimerization subunit type 1 TsaB [Lachnospiraceae bacterium]|nr:tRNA (adenosine(37)-N6)-threonylcarbamoyltransferase complex dimerization subunit type 1 TsaB [Lachnospiraceae bacterium]
MKILGIESSSMVASVALVTEDVVEAEYTVCHKKTHSQTLLPMLDEIVKMTETELSQLDAIAVSGGPGSFTGLRIGSATAKGLGLALNKPLIHIPTMDAMAYQIMGGDSYIVPMMDARRTQVYSGIYENQQEFIIHRGQTLALIADVVEELNSLGKPVILLGDGLDVNLAYVKEHLQVPYQVAPVHCNRPRAAAVASLGLSYMKEGKVEEAREHLPNYLRASQAEREREAKLKEEAHG